MGQRDHSSGDIEPQTTGRSRLRAALAALAVVTLTATLMSGIAGADAHVSEQSGVLPDGTPYLISVPEDWNGVLINDLDYVSNADTSTSLALLELGYALSGTSRHPDRRYEYDPDFEISKLLTVRDIAVEEFGDPTYLIAYGRSGGGNVALATAEHYPQEIDGAVSTCAHDAIPLMNQGLDLFFVLKSLLAPDRDDLWPGGDYDLLPDSHPDIAAGWQEVLDAALTTPSGRARMALALTVAQYPAWTAGERPDSRDLEAVTESILQTVRSTANNNRIGGQSRVMFENSAGALSWNTGVDYEEFFRNGNAVLKRVVHELYAQAGLDVGEDLSTVNASPRISPDPSAIDFWTGPGRYVTGDLTVPVVRSHTAGDLAVPHPVLDGYAAKVRDSGSNSMYRSVFIDRAGHCNFTPAEIAAQVEVLVERLETGHWPPTSPTQMNRLAMSLGTGSDSSFIRYESDRISPVVRYNRSWSPSDVISD